MPVVMQPCFEILILPRQAQVAGDGGSVCGGLRGNDGGLAKGVVAGCPDDVACFVGGLDRGAQVVVVVVGNSVLAVGVLGFDEEQAGGKCTV